MSLPNIHGLLPADLASAARAADFACEDGECRRIVARAISEGRSGLRGMKKPVRATLRTFCEAQLAWTLPAVVERSTDDDDGFVKYLFRADDGALFEAVRIPLHKKDHFTICLSSQVGCAMGCVFCATGRMGFQRNLHAHEIVGSFVRVRAELPHGARISGAVFMGQGEPLANYDEVVQAARVLSDPCGGRIEAKAISISTVGLVPQILRYAKEKHPYRLIVSLTSAIASKRKKLLPVAGAYALDDVAGAIRALHQSTGDRVTLAWVLLGGINSGEDEVNALRTLVPDVPLRINLIDVNDAGFSRATPLELHAFLDRLSLLGHPVVRRYSGGRNKDAACGMLASTRHEAAETQ